jgi:hypothetical protein
MRIAAFLIILASALAQTPDAKLQFEVASIKPSVADSGRMRISVHGGPGTKDPGLYTCENYPLPGLIRDAFGLKEYQLSVPIGCNPHTSWFPRKYRKEPAESSSI